MPTVDTVMPEDFRKRLQRAALQPRCYYLDRKVHVKLSTGPDYQPTAIREIVVASGTGRAEIIEGAEALLGGPLPE